jgi:parallel beta-helix repeat protein
MTRPVFLALLIPLLACATSRVNAETVHSCTGFIDSLPAHISTQGVWCLRRNLATNISSGAAILIDTNNVTLDCNEFKIGGLSAGNSTLTSGVFAADRINATVRNCSIRGFLTGIDLRLGSGHLVEHNRLDNNLYAGIFVSGENSLVRGNSVLDTGAAGSGHAVGIRAYGHISDNVVINVGLPDAEAGLAHSATGIDAHGFGSEVTNNLVQKLFVHGGGVATGINAASQYSVISGNRLLAGVAIHGIGIDGLNPDINLCRNNVLLRFSTPLYRCSDEGGNVIR